MIPEYTQPTSSRDVQELQDVNGFLEACPLPFSIEIAAALAARKLLNLETWLLELLQTHQDAAVQVHRVPAALHAVVLRLHLHRAA